MLAAWFNNMHHCCLYAVTLMSVCVLQLRNILQQVDFYLNKSGRSEGEYGIVLLPS